MHLSHHGIKGQKWGIRRFQNKDGSLTAKGKERYGSTNDPSDAFTLKKGTSIYRVANQDEQLSDNQPRYYSLLDDDRMVYSGELLKGLFADWSKPVGEFTNSVEKDLLVKKGDSVVSDLIQQYGNENMDSLMSDFYSNQLVRKQITDREERSNYLNELDFDGDWETQFKQQEAWSRLDDFIWDVMKEHGDEIVKDYYKKGYDGIIDPYDYIMNISDMPIIVASPGSSVRQRSFNKLHG